MCRGQSDRKRYGLCALLPLEQLVDIDLVFDHLVGVGVLLNAKWDTEDAYTYKMIKNKVDIDKLF